MRLLVTVGLLGALLAGCSGPRSGGSVTSAVAGCATVLPLARGAVPGSPVLVAVHALSRGDAARYVREVQVLATPTAAAPAPGRTAEVPAPGATATPGPTAGPGPTARPGPTATPGPTARPAPPRGCLVVYAGPFAAGTVRGAPAGTSGRYALLFVDLRHPRVRQVLLTDVLTKQLRRS